MHINSAGARFDARKIISIALVIVPCLLMILLAIPLRAHPSVRLKPPPANWCYVHAHRMEKKEMTTANIPRSVPTVDMSRLNLVLQT